MTETSRTACLGELVSIVMGQAPPSKDTNFEGHGEPFVKVGEFGAVRPLIQEWTTNPLKRAFRTDVLLCVVGATCGKVNLGEDCAIGRSVAAIRPDKNKLDQFFLHYFMMTLVQQLRSGSVGAAQTVISKEMIQTLRIPLLPLGEQKRIVAILDEALDCIATAKANVEKNLQNTRALFASHVQSVFSRTGNGWTTKTLNQISQNLDSKRIPITKSDRKPGEYRYYGASGIVDYVDSYIFDGNTLLVSEDGANLLARSTPIAFSVSGRYWVNNHAHILKFESMATQRCVEFYLESIPLDDYITGAAQPKLNQQALNSIPISIPNTIGEQQKVVDEVETLSEQTQRLESIYQQKLVALDELKKSLLHQAFTGQLTAVKPTLASQHRELKTATPQFAANIISFAYAQHAKKQRERTFGRVKEQKTLHLVEAIAKIDLGRHPMKDAAGPNDFQHMLKAEDWARAQDFFEMVDRGNGYDFKKLKDFDKHLSNARRELEPYLSSIEKVIDLLIPMDSEEAGILATVHAAWNNLLIDGIEATDGAILKEARETWHADKLSIPENKFKTAIEFIRRNRLVPDGTGKYVAGQTSLL